MTRDKANFERIQACSDPSLKLTLSVTLESLVIVLERRERKQRQDSKKPTIALAVRK